MCDNNDDDEDVDNDKAVAADGDSSKYLAVL